MPDLRNVNLDSDVAQRTLLSQLGSLGLTTTVAKAAGQPITTGGSVKYVEWDTEVEDTLEGFSLAAPTVLNVTKSGLHIISYQSAWGINATGNRYIHVEAGPSGSERIIIGKERVARDNATDSGIWAGRLTAGDRIRFGVYQNSGATVNFGGYYRPLASAGESANCELSLMYLV